MGSIALGGLSKESVVLWRRVGRSAQGGRLCGTSILVYNTGGNTRLF